MMGNRTVIVGGSIAGVFTAKELRKMNIKVKF